MFDGENVAIDEVELVVTFGSPSARASRCGWLAALCRSGTKARLDAADLDELADPCRLSRRQIDPTLADAASERLSDELGALA